MKTYKHPIYGVIPVPHQETQKELDKRLKGMTDSEKRKLGWYRNDGAWMRDIEGRKILPNGNIGVYDAHGRLKEVRSKDV